MVNVRELGFGIAGSLHHDVIRIVARRIELEGFRTLWINDTPDGDSVSGLAVAAEVTTSLRLATGVISIDRRTPAAIIQSIHGHRLPEDRLVIGIGGSAKPGPLTRVQESLVELRQGLSCRLMVGALGPKMRRLGAQASDGLLLNWLTLAAARQSVVDKDRDAATGAHSRVECCLYVRTALGPAATERMVEEAERYQRIPSYAANFARMGVDAVDTTVSGESPERIRGGLDRYSGILDELVVRAITPSDSAAEHLELIDAIVS